MTKLTDSYFRITPLALVVAALGTAGCGDHRYITPGYYPGACMAGVTEASIDTDAILDLDAGYGVGATVEYAGDGAWRFAVTCDSFYSGYACGWTLLVTPIDGTIDSFEPEALELDDVVERYPSTAGSTVEDAVLLSSFTDVGIDAFTVLATPGAGMRVNANIDGYCGGPYLYWTEGGDIQSSQTDPTDLFPSVP